MINWSSNLSSINKMEEAPHAREPAEVDRISELPDHMLACILKRLDTKDAIRTTILSKRWRHLCSLLRRLTFDYSTLGINLFELLDWGELSDYYKSLEGYPLFQERRLEFFRRVDQFFLNFKGTKIDSLSVNFFIDEETASRANQCISSAIALGVEELELDFRYWRFYPRLRDVRECHLKDMTEEDVYTFPHWLFTDSTGSSLKRLSLKNCILRPQAEVGEGFSKLKTLQLVDVYLDQVSVEAIFSKCLLLEELHLAHCILSSLKVVSASLRKLRIGGVGMEVEVEISAINLIDFAYTGRHSWKITLLDAPRLRNMFLLTPVPPREVSHALSLCSGKPHLMDPIFYVSLDKVDGAVPLQRIGSFNSIKILNHTYQENQREVKELGGGCTHRSLKQVKMDGCVGNWYEIEFVIALLEHAIALEQLVLSPYRCYYNGIGVRNVHNNTDYWPESRREVVCKKLQNYMPVNAVELLIL
ncbi:hypothetical protein Tsubulata_004071 [Turnera subulata]|uniref:F-box domain-containing protein n=1 Tax=Turnera subulata TaxID=218843 RepID=A0A9Q0F7E2_9ROSI|nr:hypothetical protein Tsubulata_004071 [Turnera subulata]